MSETMIQESAEKKSSVLDFQGGIQCVKSRKSTVNPKLTVSLSYQGAKRYPNDPQVVDALAEVTSRLLRREFTAKDLLNNNDLMRQVLYKLVNIAYVIHQGEKDGE